MLLYQYCSYLPRQVLELRIDVRQTDESRVLGLMRSERFQVNITYPEHILNVS
jgi:hypothetical protein